MTRRQITRLADHTMKNLIISILAALAVTACISDPLSNKFRDLTLDQNSVSVRDGASSINVATWNIQIFGQSKMSKPDVVEYLLKIISRYDMVTIQEIRDSSETAFWDLVDQLKKYSGKNYLGITGPRVGSSSSKEQYGFIYKSDYMKVKQKWQYPESKNDFSRPPYVIEFELLEPSKRAGDYIAFIPIHTVPDDAINEISNLVKVYDEWVKHSNNDNAIILGDFNADCSYVCKSCWDKVELRNDPRFYWLVGDNVDTTSGNSDCAYDRVVTAGDWILGSACCAVPFNYEEAYDISRDLALDISDHYPVEFNLK